MSKSARILCLSLLSMIATSIAGPILPAQAKPPLNLAIRRQQDRNEYVRFGTLIDALGITAGMTILDIGSGPGYASFLFAEKLNGTGKVFATDIREDFVKHIAGEARSRGLSNLFPVVVKADGLDVFYGKHHYDLVFLANVYHCLDERVEYFAKLRGFLNPGARLVVVLYNQAPLFSVDDLSDVDDIVRNLSVDPGANPFYKHLSTGTRQLLGDKNRKDELEKALVDDFNRMLVDSGFYKGFYGDSYFGKGLFTPPERDFANWLLMMLREEGVLEMPVDRIDPKGKRAVIRLNRLFFMKRFGDSLAQGGMGAYLPAGDANRQTSKYVMLRELDAAGYKFISEIKLSPYFDAVVLTPGTP